MRTVLIVLFDGVQSLDVTGPLEVFAGANSRASRRDGRDGQDVDRPVYQIRTASLGGGPVRTSSGLGLALALAGRIADDQTAQAIQLAIEYDPQPTYDAGSPDRAPANIVSDLRARSRFILTGRSDPRIHAQQASPR
jgi:hypothetical protein